MKASKLFWLVLIIMAVFFAIKTIPWENIPADVLIIICTICAMFLIVWEIVSGTDRSYDDTDFTDKFENWYQYSLIWIVYVAIKRFNILIDKHVPKFFE